MDIINKVREILTPIIAERDIEIVDIAYKREGPKMVLRVLLDRTGGISIDEYAELNNMLSESLNKENIIEEHHVLEVSSPGLDRPLKSQRDFERALNRNIRVTTYAPIDGRNVFIGRLLGIGELIIVVEDDKGISTEIPRQKIAKAKLEIVL